ncbi:hypothetical protein V6N12_011169 [Hibiscus sabdariffa]
MMASLLAHGRNVVVRNAYGSVQSQRLCGAFGLLGTRKFSTPKQSYVEDLLFHSKLRAFIWLKASKDDSLGIFEWWWENPRIADSVHLLTDLVQGET